MSICIQIVTPQMSTVRVERFHPKKKDEEICNYSTYIGIRITNNPNSKQNNN